MKNLIGDNGRLPRAAGAPAALATTIEILLLPIIALAGMFFLQGTVGLNLADEGYLWFGSQRVFAGDLPIRDFQSYDPGRYYWSAFIFWVTGADGLFEQRIANHAFGLVGIVAALVTLRRAGVPWYLRAIALVLLLLGMGFPGFRTYEKTLSILAVAVVYQLLNQSGPRRWFLAGAAIGGFFFFGRNHGIYLTAAVVLSQLFVWFKYRQFPGRADWRSLTIGLVLGGLPLVVFVSSPGAWLSYMDSWLLILAGKWQIGLPIPFPWRLGNLSFASLAAAQPFGVGLAFLIVPLSYVLTLAVLLAGRQRLTPVQCLLLAAACAGLTYLHHGVDRADWEHLSEAMFPWLLLGVALAQRMNSQAGRAAAWATAVSVLLFTTALFLPSQPAYGLAMSPRSYDEVSVHGRKFVVSRYFSSILNGVEITYRACGMPRDGVFFAPHFPMLYAYLNSRSPVYESYHMGAANDAYEMAVGSAETLQKLTFAMVDPYSAVDGREEYRFPNMYPQVWAALENRFIQVRVRGLPNNIVVFVDPAKCLRSAAVPSPQQ